MKCADVPDLPILEFLARRVGKKWEDGGGWAFWYDPETAGTRSICHAMPPNTPQKVRIAKMAGLIRRGLICGCPCGCRGDYEINQKGLDYIQSKVKQ
jgi:hypothetical protein